MLAILNSLSAGEVIAILVIALIVLGPEKLPDAIRKFGNIYGELRRMSHGFQSELRDAFDEPLRELRGTAQMMQDAVNDPVQTARTSMTAPVVGGGKKAETTPGTDEADNAEESQEPVEESQAPVDEVQEQDDDGQPVLAQAGLMLSEPELAVPAANGADADGAGDADGAREAGQDRADADAAADHEAAAAGDSPRDH